MYVPFMKSSTSFSAFVQVSLVIKHHLSLPKIWIRHIWLWYCGALAKFEYITAIDDSLLYMHMMWIQRLFYVVKNYLSHIRIVIRSTFPIICLPFQACKSVFTVDVNVINHLKFAVYVHAYLPPLVVNEFVGRLGSCSPSEELLQSRNSLLLLWVHRRIADVVGIRWSWRWDATQRQELASYNLNRTLSFMAHTHH